jgi:hypothetical protein
MPPAALMTGGSTGAMGAMDVAIVEGILILDCNPYQRNNRADFQTKENFYFGRDDSGLPPLASAKF